MIGVKICGVTSARDATLAIDAGADRLGFIFAPSARRASPGDVAKILAGLPRSIATVGVFVDATADEIRQVVRVAPVDMIQLHGGESLSFCRELKLPVIKRVPVFTDDDAAALQARVAAVSGDGTIQPLVDPGRGDGVAFDYRLCSDLESAYWLAGGLCPETIEAALEQTHPTGVDVCSGVERRPGEKDSHRLRRFVDLVRSSHASAPA